MSSGRSILIIDDEPGMRDMISRLFAESGYRTAGAPDGPSGLRAAKDGNFDLVLLDMSLPKMSGLEVLNGIKEHKPDQPVIMITAYGSTQTAVEALRLGAYDYIAKPFELDELQMVAERALDAQRVIDENRFLRNELKKKFGFDNIIGANPIVQKAYVVAAQVASSNAAVLILGETGTGKEYLARTIHYQSDRADGPFIKVNCAALSESLLESELFGHEKGAFTSAISRHIGRFEAANGGTIFLDEIGEVPPSVQTKLLRVLQEKQFERVGGSETLTTDVRVIAATNRDLAKAISEKQFREDLLYRLNVITLELPPIRERGEDIELFAHHFLKIYADETGRRVKHFSEDAIDELKAYSWPGNIRELENAIERAVILCNGEIIRPEHLMLNSAATLNRGTIIRQSQDARQAPDAQQALDNDENDATASSAFTTEDGMQVAEIPLTASLRDVEKIHIERVLKAKKWNQSAAANILGIDRKTLRNKVREFKLEKNRE